MKKVYFEPSIEVVEFELEDAIASNSLSTGDTGEIPGWGGYEDDDGNEGHDEFDWGD